MSPQLEQAQFTAYMKTLDYETITTFWADFAIAEAFGMESVKDTFERCMEEWKSDIKFTTELVLVLNLRSWYKYDNGQDRLSRLYADLYCKADTYVNSHFSEEDFEYYFNITD